MPSIPLIKVENVTVGDDNIVVIKDTPGVSFDEDFIEGLLGDKSAEELFPVIDQIVSDDDLIDVMQHLPDTITYQLPQSMTTQARARVEPLLSYPEDTAGGLMDTDTISVRPRVSVDVVLRYLRRHESLPATTDKEFSSFKPEALPNPQTTLRWQFN